MAGKAKKEEKQGTSILRILGVVLFIVVGAVLIFWHANFVTGRSLLLAFPGWEVTYKGCWPNPFGGAWVSDVTLMPYEDYPDEVFHFDSLYVDVPFMQFYSTFFPKKLKWLRSEIKDISLEFSGGRGTLAEPFTWEMAAFGNVSASPFEADGCMEDAIWVSEEMAEMGLQAGETELVMSWHREEGSLVREQSIHTEGVGRVDFRGEQARDDDFDLFDMVEGDFSTVRSREWHVRDEGFIAARNAHCAKKDGITPQQFVQRHLDTVERLLEADGIAPSESVRNAYRHYAERGAPLDLALNFSALPDNLSYEEFELSDWLNFTSGTFNIDGRDLNLGMREVTPRPLPETDDEEATTFALLESERATMRAQAAVAEAQAAPAPTLAVATLPASTPPPTELPFVVPAEPEVAADAITDYAKLRAEIGKRFKFYLKEQSPIRGQIVGSEDGQIRVRRQMTSGFMEQFIARANFIRAEPMR